MEPKRKISILIPYKIKDGKILVFLQKRSKTAQRLPDYYGFFGGGKENDESPEETLLREIMEEMNLVPNNYYLVSTYEFARSSRHVYAMKVNDDFEKMIKISEGEYGKFFNTEEALNEPKLIEEDKIVLKDFYKSLSAQKRKT